MGIEIRQVLVRNNTEKALFEEWLTKHGFLPSLVCIDSERRHIAIRTRYNLYEGQAIVGRLMAEIEQGLRSS